MGQQRSRPLRRTVTHGAGPAREGPTSMWPIGDPSTAEFRFCGVARTLDRPYCVEHVALAYQKVQKRHTPLTQQSSVAARMATRSR